MKFETCSRIDTAESMEAALENEYKKYKEGLGISFEELKGKRTADGQTYINERLILRKQIKRNIY